MELLYRLIEASCCRSTHHKLALHALKLLESPAATQWQRFFLKAHAAYLQGAKDPDVRWKDFRNHVLHVSQNYWGGATKAARLWYDRSLATLQKHSWTNAAYAIGNLSHYFTDPIMPFHTGQSDAESNIHRAAEWSCTKSYQILFELGASMGIQPVVTLSDDDDWLEKLVIAGAERSHEHYDRFIQLYDFDRGVKDPPTGLNDECQRFLADLLAWARVGFARILDRLIEDAAVDPPEVDLSVDTFLTTIKVPIRWITRKLADAKDQALVERMYAELKQTGRVEENLPEDDREIRDAIAAEFGPQKSKPTKSLSQPATLTKSSQSETRPTKPSQSAQNSPSPRLVFRLQYSDDVVDAPSIGPKTAKRLIRVGIRIVRDLINCDAEQKAAEIKTRYITADVLRDWQDQARLMCNLPNIYGHDSQILVGAGFRDAASVQAAELDDLLAKATAWVHSSAGQRALRNAEPPDREEVQNWIAWANAADESVDEENRMAA